MNHQTMNRVAVAGCLVAVVLGLLAVWNGYQTSAIVQATETPPTTGQVGAVAVPSLGALAGGLTGLLAWVAKRWVPGPGGAKTLDLLRAIAVLIDAGAGQQAKLLLDGFKANGFPPSGRIVMQWPGSPPVGLEWGVKPEESTAGLVSA